jgi:glucose-1-phosphate cytidylyltransferase
MKAVILAGGLGTRLSEETSLRPKPMIEVGGRPILWHILKIYSAFDITDFVVCLGYKGYMIKEYFANYFLHMSDVTFDMKSNQMTVLQKNVEPWKITLVDTGDNTMTGGRLLRVKEYIGSETFCFTYGDGLIDLDLNALIRFHKGHGKWATVTAVQPPGRYGALKISDGAVLDFQEKPTGDGSWVNGGFFVLEPEVMKFIDGDHTIWEQDPLMALVARGQLQAFQHQGFWQAMDTLRDKNRLEELWRSGKPPWKIWKE